MVVVDQRYKILLELLQWVVDIRLRLILEEHTLDVMMLVVLVL